VINRDVVVDEKIPFFSDNGKSMDSSVWETVVDSGTSSGVEIKQGSEPKASEESSSRGDLVKKRRILILHNKIRKANTRD
jgi:hypothetical protein